MSIDDTFCLDLENRLDYAHAGPAFTTWHKYFHVLFEWEIQYMLKSRGHMDYHTFRLPYWDRRIEIQRSIGILAEDLFTEKKLGATRNVSGFPRVFGDIVGDVWDTICWDTFFRFVIQMLTPILFSVVHSQELIHTIVTILTSPQVSK